MIAQIERRMTGYAHPNFVAEEGLRARMPASTSPSLSGWAKFADSAHSSTD